MRRLGLPENFVPPTEAEAMQVWERCVDLLRAPTRSGYKEVHESATKGKWQAKPYVGPKDQRNLGTFDTAREAAAAILAFKMGSLQLKSPKNTERNKRGQGPRPRDRRRGMRCTCTTLACSCQH
jgi:hypothetical protein